MKIADLTLTPALRYHLRHEHDDGCPQLVVRQRGADVLVEREDGSELSEREAAGVRGLVAAHRVEPLQHPGGRPRLPAAEVRDVRLSVRWTADEAADLASGAELSGESVSDLVRRASLEEARRRIAATRRPRKTRAK